MDLGDRFVSTTFYTKFTTVNGSGVPTTLGNTPTLEFYVGAGATAFTVGLSLDVDFNSRTGLNMVTVIATSSATAWTSGIDVQVVIATGSVSGVAMKGYKVCEFSLNNRAGLRPSIAGRNLVVESDGMAHADTREVGGGTVPSGAIPNAVAGAAGGVFIAGSNAATTTASLTTGALACTTITASGTTSLAAVTTSGTVTMNALTVSNATTLTGAVSLGSTLGVAGTTTFAAINTGTITTTGNWAVSGSVTFTGGLVSAITGSITGNLSGSVGSVTGAVGSVTAGVTVTTNNDKTGYALSATGSAALTEGYRANGAAGTLPQLLYEVIAHLGESSIVTTTKTINKIDHSTPAATFTLDDATTPTSITRAT